MNTPVAFQYVLNSSDSRSFPIRPRLYIPKYDGDNLLHRRISKLSKIAHQKYNDEKIIKRIVLQLNSLYIEIAQSK